MDICPAQRVRLSRLRGPAFRLASRPPYLHASPDFSGITAQFFRRRNETIHSRFDESPVPDLGLYSGSIRSHRTMGTTRGKEGRRRDCGSPGGSRRSVFGIRESRFPQKDCRRCLLLCCVVTRLRNYWFRRAVAYGSSMDTNSVSRNAASVHAFMPGVVSSVCW